MNLNKAIQQRSLLMLTLCLMLALSSCGDPKGDEPGNPNEEWSEESSGQEPETTDYYSLVKKYASATVKYDDYDFIITINTSLKSKLPDKTIEYGIAVNYDDFPGYWWDHVFGEISNKYTCTEPIFINGYGSPYISEFYYYRSYKALKDRTLTSDEKDLYRECLSGMNEAIRNGADSFRGKIFAKIGSNCYYFHEFTFYSAGGKW